MNNDIKIIQQALEGVGSSKTIYALVMPETEAIKSKVQFPNIEQELKKQFELGGSLNNEESIKAALKRAQEPYFDMFREAWTQKQDNVHHEFFDRWLEWSKPISPINKEVFKFRYPTAGAGEGLKSSIEEYGNRARKEKFEPEIHIFNGEYEGYGAYADAAYIPVIKHDRNNWKDAVEKIAAANKEKPVQIYLSQPSALDGNIWGHYDDFMKLLAEKAPKAELILDVTYVGCITQRCKIETDYPNIKAIVFSLSKPIGGYYDRIGGVVAKDDGSDKGPYPSLFGNMWFKNLTSLAIGNEFMKTYNVFDMPDKYSLIQKQAIEKITQNLSDQQSKGHDIKLNEIKPSDVFTLGTAELSTNPNDLEKYLSRPADGKQIVRICLTPTMANIIGMAKSSEVSPRFYEKL